jgi:broad specificity phosphatase PhoE
MTRTKPTPDLPGSITIARHGRPDMDRKTRVDWRGYEDWWADYDRAGLAPEQAPPPELIAAGQEARVIFASTLPRAIETAREAAPGREIVIDPVFVEAPLPPPTLPGQFPAHTWNVFARTAWWCGMSRGQESRRQAELRAEAAAARLIEAAQSGPVLLCAHGWFNRMMRPVLRSLGWRCVRDGGDYYWTHRRYEFRPDR